MLHFQFSLWKNIYNYRDICCFSFFNNTDIYYMINVYSDASQTALKYLKDTEANIHNILVMAGNFNIRNSSWDLSFNLHLIYSNLITDIADFLDLILSNSTNQASTRYLDNANDANSVIDLIFLWPNSLEINNHTIYLEFWYSSDYALLTVNIFIIKEFVLDKWHTIIKNSEEEDKFIAELIKAIKKINTEQLSNKVLLELTVQEFANKSDVIWFKYSKCINIIKHSKA